MAVISVPRAFGSTLIMQYPQVHVNPPPPAAEPNVVLRVRNGKVIEQVRSGKVVLKVRET